MGPWGVNGASPSSHWGSLSIPSPIPLLCPCEVKPPKPHFLAHKSCWNFRETPLSAFPTGLCLVWEDRSGQGDHPQHVALPDVLTTDHCPAAPPAEDGEQMARREITPPPALP